MEIYEQNELSAFDEALEDDEVDGRIKELEEENTYLKKQLYQLRQYMPSQGDPLGGS